MTIIGFDEVARARAAFARVRPSCCRCRRRCPTRWRRRRGGRQHQKGRPAQQPAGCLVPTLDDVRGCLDLTDDAFALAGLLADAERLTLFLPVRDDAVPDWLRPWVSGGCAGLMTACLPPFAPLLRELGRLFLSSGNRTTQVPATTAAEADAQFDGALLTLDGEPWRDPSVEHGQPPRCRSSATAAAAAPAGQQRPRIRGHARDLRRRAAPPLARARLTGAGRRPAGPPVQGHDHHHDGQGDSAHGQRRHPRTRGTEHDEHREADRLHHRKRAPHQPHEQCVPSRNRAVPPATNHAVPCAACAPGCSTTFSSPAAVTMMPATINGWTKWYARVASRPGSSEAVMASTPSRARRSKYSHHSATAPANANTKALVDVTSWCSAAERRTGGHDRLAERDDQEALAALGEVAAVDRPLVRLGAPQAGGPEPDEAAEAVDRDRGQPPQLTCVPVRQAADERAGAADDAPREDAQEVAAQRLVLAQGPRRVGRTADLHRRVGPAHPQAAVAEGVGQADRHDQAAQHHDHQHHAGGRPVGVEPVGHPRRVDPDDPHQASSSAESRAPCTVGCSTSRCEICVTAKT